MYIKKHNWIKDDAGKKIMIGSRQYYILKWIHSFEKDGGLSFSDIIRYITGLGEGEPLRNQRGVYSNWMSGQLPRWSKKTEDGKYVITDKNLLDHFNRYKYAPIDYGIVDDVIDKLIDRSYLSKENYKSLITKIRGSV